MIHSLSQPAGGSLPKSRSHSRRTQYIAPFRISATIAKALISTHFSEDPMATRKSPASPILSPATAPSVPPLPPVPSSEFQPDVAKPLPQPKKLRVKTVGQYPINCYPVHIVVYPDAIFEVPEHAWVRRQINLGTLVEV